MQTPRFWCIGQEPPYNVYMFTSQFGVDLNNCITAALHNCCTDRDTNSDNASCSQVSSIQCTQPSHSLPAATFFTGECRLLYAQSSCAWLAHKNSHMVRTFTCPRASSSPADPFASSWQHSSTCNTEATAMKVIRTAPMHAHTHDHP